MKTLMRSISVTKRTDDSQGEGIILVSFLLLLMALVIGVSSFYAFAAADYFASLRNEYNHQAFYAAEAGIDQKIVELSKKNTAANMSGTLSTGQYQGTYQVTCAPCTGTGNETLTSTGTIAVNGFNYSRTVRVTLKKSSIFNATSSVAISGVASTSGSVTIDGRDHDTNGNLTGGPGVYGISTSSSTFNQGGSSQVGGNGIAPANPAAPVTYQVNAPAIPATPEGVLGLGAGALDAYKTSTPPATPFTNQIIYLTASWDGVDFNGSSGILICHNSAGNAFLKNIHGSFKGLIIADDLIHVNGNAELIGAIVGMKTSGVTIGNGSAEVKYSSQVLSALPIVRYTVTSWEDSRNDSL